MVLIFFFFKCLCPSCVCWVFLRSCWFLSQILQVLGTLGHRLGPLVSFKPTDLVCCRTLHTGKVYTYTCTYILYICVWLFWLDCISCIIVLLEMVIKLLEWVRNSPLYFAPSILKYQFYPLVNQLVVSIFAFGISKR